MNRKKTYDKLKKMGVVNDDVKVSDLESMFKQVGGTHYMYMAIQPAEFINANKLLFAEGNAIKYICRHSQKSRVEDIDKAIHYLEMIKERDYK
tara:strand:- start:226 stop:504 length:279 start_codon:yes stop_codon:yes gene_type:complete